MVDQTLATLDMMDFDGKDSIIQKVQENADLQQRLVEWQQLALALADRYDPVMGEGLAQQILQEGGQAVPQLPHMGQVRRLPAHRLVYAGFDRVVRRSTLARRRSRRSWRMRAKSRKKARSRDKNRRLRWPVLAGLFLAGVG